MRQRETSCQRKSGDRSAQSRLLLRLGFPAGASLSQPALRAPPIALPHRILPRQRTAAGTIEQIGRNSGSAGTYAPLINLCNKEPRALRTK